MLDPTTIRGPIAPETTEALADRFAVGRLAPTYAFGIDSPATRHWCRHLAADGDEGHVR